MNTTETPTLNTTIEANCTINCSVVDSGLNGISPTNHPVLNVLTYVNYIALPSFLVLGLTGNSLTLMVMNGKRFANQTSALFLTALSISDTILLLTQPFNKIFVMQLFGTDLRALSEAGCKIFFIIFKTSKMTSSWFLVFLCLERFVAVWFPLKAKVIFTKRVGLAGIAAVYLIIGSYTSVWSYASKIDDKGICHPDTYDKTNPKEIEKFGRFIVGGVSLYSLVPTAILLTLTPLIIGRLVSRSKAMRKLTGNSKRKQVETNKTTAMLVGVMVAYIVLILPVTFLHLGAFLFRLNAFGTANLGFTIFKEVSQVLEQVNYAINFFLYVLSSSTFRAGLKDVVCIKLLYSLRTKTSDGSNVKAFGDTVRRTNSSMRTKSVQLSEESGAGASTAKEPQIPATKEDDKETPKDKETKQDSNKI